MKRFAALITASAITLGGLVALTSASAGARTLGPNGQITFSRDNADDRGPSLTYTMNPDGTRVHALFPSADTEHPHWSPNGSEIAMECDSCGGSALIVNPDTGSYRVLPRPDPRIDIGCFTAWSPDGTRLACAGFGKDDASLDGVYTVRSSDGGDLRRVVANPGGGIPGDYSPDGKQLSFVGADSNGDLRIFVVNLDGSGLTPITPAGMFLGDENGGSWSPTGNHILFVARPTADGRRAIWVVGSDGSGLRQIPIPQCGGAMSDPRSIGCGDPVWSPDGTKIAFVRITAKTHQKNIWVVNPDGTGLSQVTRTGFQDFGPDWGTHPPT